MPDQCVITILKTSYGQKQACKDLRNSHKRIRSCVYKHMRWTGGVDENNVSQET
jgi:hypothetical protein